MNFTFSIFQLIVLIFSAIVHEVANGAMALKLGDKTAKDLGRLTLNPLKHLDPFGSVLLPLFLYLVNSPILFGWARPVPYNPFNLKNPKTDEGKIAIAGPISNFGLAVIFSLILKAVSSTTLSFSAPLALFLNIIILVNIVLGVFNLVPIPPLDGSKVLFAVLPSKFRKVQIFLEQYGIFILLFFLFFGFNLILPIIAYFFHLLGGTII